MKMILQGQVASKISVTGVITLTSNEVIRRVRNGERVIFIKEFMQPEDTLAIKDSVGVITITGGLTSHASIVAREFGKACIINVSDIQISIKDKLIIVNNVKYNEGIEIFMDALTGGIYLKNDK